MTKPRPTPRLLIGLMSGTSVDAIDAALVKITTTAAGRYSAKVLHHTEHPWPPALRKRLLAIMAPASTTTQELCELNILVAHQFVAATEKLLAASNTPRKKITALASHGQTICHLPPAPRRAGGGVAASPRLSFTPSTLQIGDPSTLATLTRIPTIANFRPADIAVGGQGAPLVPWADAALLTHPKKSRAIQNIGGIANVTFLPPSSSKRPVIAFDTGPGNMLLDAVISLATHGKFRFDANGHRAAQGILDFPLFQKLQAHPYFKKLPPKSTGREEFGITLATSLLPPIKNQKSKIENLLHTLTRLTAWSIAHAYRTFLPAMPDEVILCGGGADNPTLTAMLKQELPHTTTLSRIDQYAIPNKSKEAASFALLAAATLDDLPSNLPSVTGASRPVILGTLSTP